MGGCGNHWKWLQLRSCKIECKSVRKISISWPFLFIFWKKFLWGSRRWEPPRWGHQCSIRFIDAISKPLVIGRYTLSVWHGVPGPAFTRLELRTNWCTLAAEKLYTTRASTASFQNCLPGSIFAHLGPCSTWVHVIFPCGSFSFTFFCQS